MGTFKEILDTLKGIEGEAVDFITTGQRHKSLARSATEGTFNFPVIVSNMMSVEDATLISKALERQFASFSLTVLTMNPYLYTSGAPTAQKYLKKYHQNLDFKTDATDIINTVTSLATEAAKLDITYDQMEECAEQLAYHIYEGVNYKGINTKNISLNYSINDVTESAILNDKSKRIQIVKEDTNSTTNDVAGDININVDNVDLRRMGSAMGISSGGSHDKRQFNNKVDMEFKKSNELVPTLLHVRIFPVDKSNPGVKLDPLDFIIGIKATLHPVSSEEMIVNIARGIKNDSRLFNFIRWTTGETSFIKDFILGLNELKLDAINNSNKSSKWWTMLKRRKALAKIKNVVMPDRLLPNATIIITQDEVDELNKIYGYDLTKSSLVNKLMTTYFLIAFVIVDPALQRAKFMFDGKTEFETLTFAGLSRENSVDDKKFKDMMNMLGRRV